MVAKNGTGSVSNKRPSHADETRSSSALHNTASGTFSPSPLGRGLGGRVAPSNGNVVTLASCHVPPPRNPLPRGEGESSSDFSCNAVRSRCTACIRQRPCGVETSNASPGAVAAKPCRRAQAAVRPNASSSRVASESIRTQSCPRPMIGARKRNRLPVPAPRSSRRGRLGSRSANRRASATLRAAWSNGSRSVSQSASKCSVTRPGPARTFPPASANSARPDQPAMRLPQRRDANSHRR